MIHPFRLYRTLSHLKPSQIRALLMHRTSKPALPAEAPPHTLSSGRPSPPCRISNAGYDGASFEFHAKRHPAGGAAGWYPAAAPLWIYNLHYFQYIWGLPSPIALQLIEDWMKFNDLLRGPSWDPYPISLRAREWMEWMSAHPDIPQERKQKILGSLVRQINHLAAHPEIHLQGNHLLENAITLCWAALRLEGTARDRWHSLGLDLLEETIDEQILPDGTHEERSPMYQALISETLLRLSEVAKDSAFPGAHRIHEMALSAGSRMIRSLSHQKHPDGDWAQFNDCALGVAPTLAELLSRFSLPEPEEVDGLWLLPEAGYGGWRDTSGNSLIMDGGPLGPDCQPGHGHADVLSFELSTGGRRLICDTGVYTYEPGPVRTADRCTAAHNTIHVDRWEQAELWDSFRCGARPLVDPLKTRQDGLQASLQSRWPGGPVFHRREVRIGDREFLFRDHLKAPHGRNARLMLHLAPGVIARSCTAGMELLRDGVHEALIAIPGHTWKMTEKSYHPSFGEEQERLALFLDFRCHDSVNIEWLIIYGAH